MFGRLDRYIARSFLEPFLVATAAIVGLYLVGDAFNDLDDYLREAGKFMEALSRMGQIYALRLPAFLAPVLPVSMLVGAAYGIAQLSSHNEVMAMKASGVSFWRMLAPIYVLSVFIALAGFANRELLVPEVEQLVAARMQKWMGKGDKYTTVVDYLEMERTQYTLQYNVANHRARMVFILTELPDHKHSYLFAQEAVPVPDGWLLRQVQAGDRSVPEMKWKTTLRPRDLEMRLLPPEAQPLPVIRRGVKRTEGTRENQIYRVHYHAHLAYPFTGIILVALGVPFVVGSERLQRSRMLGIGACMGICMVFYTVQYIALDLGLNNRLPAPLAAWLPIVIFAALGLYLLETVHS